MRSTCVKCGITKKSGKMSCCGRGGSWFGNCGSAGGAKLEHTWSEGLQVCKERGQSAMVISEQLSGDKQQRNDSSNGAGNPKFKAVMMADKLFAFRSVPMSDAPPIIAPANTFTAHTILTVNSRPISTAVTTIISRLSNIWTHMLSINTNGMAIIMSACIPITRNSTTRSLTTRVRTRATSQGFGQLLDITVVVSLLLAAAVVWC